MANEVVKYHNDLNGITMKSWTSEEMNFFFSILSKLRDEGTKTVRFTGDELKELAGYENREIPRFVTTIKNLARNVTGIQYEEETDNSFEVINLFNRFKATWNDDMSKVDVEVSVSESYAYIINQLDAEFTTYELKEFVSIRSTYAKSAYRLLKQWRTAGRVAIDIEEFKHRMNAPDYYQPSHINKNIIQAIERELPQHFKNLKVETVKANSRGNPVKSYIFTFKPEKTTPWVDDKYVADKWFSEQQKNASQPSEPVPMINWLKEIESR